MTLHRRSVTVRAASVAAAIFGATFLLAAPPLGLPTWAQTAGGGPVVSGIADAPVQPAVAVSGIADAPAQPVAPVSGIADTPTQPTTASGIADSPNQPSATSGIADAPGQPSAPVSGIADVTNQPAAPANSGIASSPSQPSGSTSGIADAPGNAPSGPQTSGIAGIAAPGAPAEPVASGIAAPGVPEPEQYQGPARAPSGAAPKIPVRVQGPAYGRRGPAGPRPFYGRGGGGFAYAPRVLAAAPIAQAPRLPNTGTGGLLQTTAPEGVTPWLPALLLLSALGLGGSAAYALRRVR